MPHVLENLAYGRACLRKRPFDSKEAALALSEEFDAYRCRYCGKWHRTSKRPLKTRLREKKQQDKAYRKAKALRKRAILKQFYEH